MDYPKTLLESEVPLVDVQTVCDYLSALIGDGQGEFDISKLPCLKPPFPMMTMRFQFPGHPSPFVSHIVDLGDRIQVAAGLVDGRTARHLIEVKIDDLGGFVSAEESVSRQVASEWATAASSAATVTLLAISFMHTKGSLVQPPEHVTRQARRSWNRSKQKIHVLRIEPLEWALRERHESQGSDGVRVHIVRGHFKDCRKHGVGGKEYAKGIYWWQPAVRGNVKKGLVAKQYETGSTGVLDDVLT